MFQKLCLALLKLKFNLELLDDQTNKTRTIYQKARKEITQR